jgi:hypothetical protein
MSEDAPLERAGAVQPTKVKLSGPNVISTFEVPPRDDAVKTQVAVIRKHLMDRRPGQRREDSS